MLHNLMHKLMLWWYKRKARRLFWLRERMLSQYDCGLHLATYISGPIFITTQRMYRAVNKARMLEGLPPIEHGG